MAKITVDLSGEDHSHSIQYEKAHFEDSVLRGTKFDYANLKKAHFRDTVLDGGSFIGANMKDVHFHGSTSAEGASFLGADLSKAKHMYRVDLEGAKYSVNAIGIADTKLPKHFDPVAAGMILVPEPSTALLATLGLIGLAFCGKKRKRR